MFSVTSFLKGKSAEDYQQKIDKYNKQLEELDEHRKIVKQKDTKIAEIQENIRSCSREPGNEEG
jgi:hypothetical protein